MPGLLWELRSHGDTDIVPNPFTEPQPDYLGAYFDADPGSEPGPEPESDFGAVGLAEHFRPDRVTISLSDYLGSYHVAVNRANHLRADARTYTAADNHTNPRSNSDVPRGSR